MKKKVSEALADNILGALGGAYDFAKDVNNPLASVLARRKTGLSAEQQKAYEIFRKNFINDIADLIDYGIDRNEFTLADPTVPGVDIATQRKDPRASTYSYPSDFKGSRTWTNTKDWLEAYRDELEAIANKDPEPAPQPKPQIKSQMSLDIDDAPEPGQVPNTGALGTKDWTQFNAPAIKRKRGPRAVATSTPADASQMTTPGVSEPITFGGVKYYKVNGRWVNAKGKAADKNTSDLLDRVPLDESYPVKATVNGVTYTYSKNGWYCDNYKAEGELATFLNESYMAALVETINFKQLQKKYTQLLESQNLPTLGDYLYHNIVKKHIEANNLSPVVRQQIIQILDNLHKSVDSKNKTQLTNDIENMAFLIFKNSYNLMPRLMRNPKR